MKKIIVFQRYEDIYIVDIINTNEYKIKQIINVHSLRQVCVFDDYIISTWSIYEKVGNQYKINNSYKSDNYLPFLSKEKYYFKHWEIIIEVNEVRGGYYWLKLYFKKINENSYKHIKFGSYFTGFFKNQILFIDPSYIIIGNDQILLNLDEEYKVIENEFYENFYDVKECSFFKEEEEEKIKIHVESCPNGQRCCYRNLNKNSFIYLINI